ncbi:MAG: DNA replication/repair protein RecF [Oscillospiraceae bacterium]|nr:DNA replication/repair protein RecF [Oscillospiraceae bacterium]
MRLISEKILNFRNIASAEFVPSETVTVICGENGQGKTNLLESIFLLSGAKSFRKVKDREMITKEEEFSVIDALFFAGQREQSFHFTISDKGRRASLNHGSEQKASDFAGTFCCVVFSPDHLELVKGTPSERRRFLDTALCQLSPRYLNDLRNYTRLIQQKNTLLKDARGIAAAFDILDIYDRQLADNAVGISKARRAFVGQLDLVSREAYASISGKWEEMELGYQSTLFDSGDFDPEEAYKRILAARTDDIRAGFSTVGPHRDDLDMKINGDPAKIYASQGQQRTAVLALKLAEAELFRQKLEEEPILLLDDVLSELDGYRQEFLLKRLGRSQAIITCCDPNFVERQTDAKVFRMHRGVLTEE